ncbi:thioredoxin reductase GliT [Penicillium cosmopolitanum]|uniref:Thioredoxin reductase GliT n=1 Tax=Penicillium cosmopolitanum TaxID=1131564 RepID=A0A9W9W151_9EURO|nr:thioredoxin reductase GliT [Penicillium cosmopolitanum]KAJ5396729.1 thioredoxin reductase GliT [Penicillium cosmopolitanum]
MANMLKTYDVLIIGGGPAGLSIATGLARQLYTSLVLDSGVYRNERGTHMHNVAGFDHVNPAIYRAKARQDLQKRYDTIEFVSAKIQRVRKVADLFEAVDDQGKTYRGRKLALGTGVRDVVEEQVEGYAECWGRSIFHCLFCHGYEERGADSVGALATGTLSSPETLAHIARMAKRLSKHVNIYTNGNSELITSTKAIIHSNKIAYDDRKIIKFEHQDGSEDKPPLVVLHFEDGTSKNEGFIVSHPRAEQRAPFAAQLGLEMTPAGHIKLSTPFNETSLPGCVAAGDAGTPMQAVVQAAQMGAFAAVGLVAQLQRELDEKDEL